MKIREEVIRIAKNAKAASRAIAALEPSLKNRVLEDMAQAIQRGKNAIILANRRDLKKAASAGLSAAFIDRLTLSEKRIDEMSASLKALTALDDPVGAMISQRKRPNGLCIQKVRVPIGVIAIIYESRPNVTADCIGLCFKSGNSVILRGGSESLNSNLAIFRILRSVLKKHDIPASAINLISVNDRTAIGHLLKLNDFIDLVIPRGGEGLINKVLSVSRIPVIKHYKGICHVYVDSFADLRMAGDICYNAKVQRPGVCNAMECMLVHEKVAGEFLPVMLKRFIGAGVEIRGCRRTAAIFPGITPVTEKDYHTEYLDMILSVKVVNSVSDAIEHINFYGSHHSDSIVTKDRKNASLFLSRVDSACVYLNASTRFTDGYQFGMGAEIGISTDKIHARGPMGLEELTTYKYIVLGAGQLRK